MTKKNMLMALALLATASVRAEKLPVDSLKVVDLEEVTIIAAPKENTKLREQALSSTLLSQDDMRANQVNSVKNLSAIVPNLFIPDYGSKLTTSIYIRGIGSRTNTPSVGLYVDNVPYIEKSAFDFDYYDIERVDVLRGPQGTLYGRNTMGGLIKVHTKSPFNYQGTDVILGAATYGDYKASLTRYHRLSNKLAFSAGGFYDHTGGFFRNVALDNQRVDKSDAGGGRLRAIYFPTSDLKLDASVNYSYSDQGGYPYAYTGVTRGLTPDGQEPAPTVETRPEYMGKIAYNRRSGYRRGLLNAGLTLEYQARGFILSSVTGFQNLNDRMSIDQDFTEKDIYTLCQRQRSNTLSEELVMKSKPGGDWQWVTGAFGFYQWLRTNAPVTFREDGVKEMIEGNVNHVFDQLQASNPMMPPMGMTIHNTELGVPGTFRTPTMNLAIYHQSTYNDLLVDGLSLTVGLRLDLERMKMSYDTSIDPMNFDFSVGGRPFAEGLVADYALVGTESDAYLQLLPKFALQYEWERGNNVYATVSKGYRSGGYNIQGFSELIQQGLRNSAMDALRAAAPPQVGGMIPEGKPVQGVGEATTYKPEYTWSYEAGARLTLWQDRLWADLSGFYMNTRDQQISEFVESGLGRVTVNAGKSHSYGAELGLRASLTRDLSLQASYGYTYAAFTDYVAREKMDDGTYQDVSYNGKRVPFVPRHTLSVGGQYGIPFGQGSFVDRLVLQASYNAAGRVYWTERNNVSQAFYGLLGMRLSAEMGNASASVWARNILDRRYTAFYFETMSKGFAQMGNPVQLGIELRCRF